MASYQPRTRTVLALLALQCLCACNNSSIPDSGRPLLPPNAVEWTAIEVNAADGQADANLLRFPNGENYLLDAGDSNGKLVDELKRQNVQLIDKVFISHAHKDHYNGLVSLLESSIRLKRVFINIPDRRICDSERPWGCDYAEVENTVKLLRQHGVEVGSMLPGDVLFREGQIRLEVLYAYDGINTPVGKTDINDMSVIMLLSNGGMRVLFTGDLNLKLGTYLANTGDARLKAQFLKMPHHGAESLAPDSFFDWVDPQVILVPAPAKIWRSDRCQRARDWAEAKKVTTYVTGITGNFKVSLRAGRYEIATPTSQ